MNPILCSGENPQFLIFDFSTIPLLLFYTYIPAIAIALVLGFFVLSKDRSLAGKLLFLITLFFSLWVLDILVLWVASYNDVLYFGWQITPIFETLLFIFSAYFALVMTNKERRDIKPFLKIFFLFLMTVVFVLLPTKFNIVNYDIENCEGKPGLLFGFMYGGEILSVLFLSYICIRRFIQTPKNDPFRKKIFYFGASIISFLVLFSGSNIVGQITGIQQISFIGSLGMVVFLGCLVYLIVKYKEFNIKLMATQAIVWCLVVLIGSQFFFIEIPVYLILNIVTFVAISIFGHFLIKSVKKEIEQREKIEKLAGDLEKANEHLHELDRQKDELLSIVSHQLATPVSAVRWNLEMMLDGDVGKFTKEQADNLKSLQDISGDLSDLVSMILDVSRIQLGRVNIDKQELDLEIFYKEILEIIKPKAQEKKVKLEISLPKKFPKAMLDKRYTHMTIENLLSNAVKYTPAKGDVKFDVKIKRNTMYCTVKDNGVGIPKQEQDKIFGKLFRASNVRNTVDGNGFGLYVAKGAIESQGGKIWFESEEGKGTTFFVELPLVSKKNTMDDKESKKN